MNTPTPVIFDNEARTKILEGANVVYESVRRTMGPQGGNALIYGLYSRPYRVTNDGYTVADIIELKDPHRKLAAEAVKDTAKRTNILAGDGTSCTTVMTGAGLNSVIPVVNQAGDTEDLERAFQKKGDSKHKGVMDIKRELFVTRDMVVEALKKMSKEIKSQKELQKIATISVESEEYGKVISEMAWKVGTAGYIDTVEGFNGKIETEMIEGSRFPAKIPAKVFVNKLERYEMEVVDAQVLLTNYVITKEIMATFIGKLQGLQRLVIIAPDFKQSALVSMAQVNKKNGDLIYAPVKVPSLKTVQFEDIEVFSGARFINKDKGDKPDDIRVHDLGFFSKLVVKDADTREDAVALGGRGMQGNVLSTHDGEPVKIDPTPVEKRIEVLTKQIESTREQGQKELLRRRIAGLSSAVGVIRVSCDSEGETYYWKKKIEDAVASCRAALEEGYVPGGGLALKEIAEKLPDTDLLKQALMAPYNQIQENAGGIEIGPDVIDPTKAIRCAVEHSVSVIANLATVKIMIPEEQERTPAEGYADIARAIMFFNSLWSKERGIKIENDEEIIKDQMAHHDAVLRNVVD